MTRCHMSPATLLAAASLMVAVSHSGPADACSLAQFSDDGRYVGRGLVEQIAAKSDQIEIVRVSDRYLVERTYTQGEWFLDVGDLDVPEGRPEFTDFFAFALETVEVLKAADRNQLFGEESLRVGGYDTRAWGAAVGPLGAAGVHPNALPVWLPDRPGHDGYAFVGDSDRIGLSGGDCSAPYILEVGQTFIAFRDSIGRLYPPDGGFPLKIDVEFRTPDGRREAFGINMQSLVPISGPDDPFLTRLRQAIAAPQT